MTATEEAPATTEADSPTAWRALPADTLTGNSVILHTLAKEEVTTAGEVYDLLDADRDGFPPFNLTEGQVEELKNSLHRLASADPEYTPFTIDTADYDDDPTSPAALAEYDAETAKVVAEGANIVDDLEASWHEKHRDAAEAKKEYETGVTKLRNLIAERRDNRGKRDLFTEPVSDGTGDPLKPDPLADLWQEYPLDFDHWGRFGLTEKDCEKLNGGETKNHGTHPLVKFGDVMRFIIPDPKNPSYARSLKDFKGFGDKGAERFAEAETQYWAWWSGGGKHAFAEEKGITADASQPDPGAGTDPSGGDGATAAGEVPSLESIDGGERNPVPDGTEKPKRKAKGKGRAK